MDTFRIEEREMWPEACPGCGYSWRGLEVGRCPECGEAAREGEVVLVGRSAQGTIDFSPTWLGNVWWPVAASVALVPLLHVLGPASWKAAAAGGGVTAAAAMVLGTAMWWTTKRRGYPLGVLWLNAQGYRRGLGATMGPLHPWRRGMRVSMRKRREGEWRIRCERRWGGVGLYPAFDLIAAFTEERAVGILERLVAWGVEVVE